MKGDGTFQPSLSDIATHNTAKDFWTVIHGKVYDMSGFVPLHPGGSLILLAAGTDCTVMFDHYHLSDLAIMQGVLRNRQIGVLNGKSPKMGLMYQELKRRVAERLRGEPKRPRRAQHLFLLDLFLVLCLLVWSFFATTASPRWQLFLAAQVAPTLLLRLFGQSHALGHLHVWPASSVQWWGRLLLALGAPGIGMFAFPGSDSNPRKMMNEPRVISQSEYPQQRGPGEHQSIHHVRGADLEHDECYHVASVLKITRLSSRQIYWAHHGLQHYRGCQCLVSVGADLALVIAVAVAERISFMTSWFIPQMLWADIGASLIGLFVSCIIARAHFLLLLTGMDGLFLYALGWYLKQLLMADAVQLFFAQHLWDHEVDDATANQDWGRHNAETSISLRGLEWHPAFWGMAGASPSTLTYHLEHTLFPGVSYLNLPNIAPIVESTCKEFGVSCSVVTGTKDLRSHYQAAMRQYAVPPSRAQKA